MISLEEARAAKVEFLERFGHGSVAVGLTRVGEDYALKVSVGVLNSAFPTHINDVPVFVEYVGPTNSQ